MIEISVLSSNRSVLGIEVQRSGAINKDYNGEPVFQRTVEITLGFLFGYISIHINLGSGVHIDEMIGEYKEIINKDNTVI